MENCPTGVGVSFYVYIVLAIIVVGAIIAVLAKKRNNNRHSPLLVFALLIGQLLFSSYVLSSNTYALDESQCNNAAQTQPTDNGTNAPVVISDDDATPPAITQLRAETTDKQTELIWEASGDCSINHGIGSVDEVGSITIEPTADSTTYTLTCSDSEGSVSESVTVPAVQKAANASSPVTFYSFDAGESEATPPSSKNQSPSPNPKPNPGAQEESNPPLRASISQFTTQKSSLLPGQTTQLTWNAVGDCSIDQGVGQVSKNGNRTVGPTAASTKYTLTCSTPGRSVSKWLSVSVSQQYNNDLPRRMTSPDTFWYQKLADNAPLDTNSTIQTDYMIQKGIERFNFYANGNNPYNFPTFTINTVEFTNPLYVASNSDPTYTIEYDTSCGGSRHPDWTTKFANLHIPADAQPSSGADGQIVVYNKDSKKYFELFSSKYDSTTNTWSACHGFVTDDVSTYLKTDPTIVYNGAIAGSGLLFEPGTIKAQELQEQHISHVMLLSLPVDNINRIISSPATRSDGNTALNGDNRTISEGQLLRLPADLDLSQYNFNDTTMTIAKAAQEYGFVVSDRSGAITLYAENVVALPSDPYPALFDGANDANVLLGYDGDGKNYDHFPWEELVVLESDLYSY